MKRLLFAVLTLSAMSSAWCDPEETSLDKFIREGNEKTKAEQAAIQASINSVGMPSKQDEIDSLRMDLDHLKDQIRWGIDPY